MALHTSEDIRLLCPGDSTEVYGQWYKTETTLERHFTGSGGCDSIHTVQIQLRQSQSITDTIRICANQTSDIFGAPVSKAGTYTQRFTNVSGCDSIQTFVVLVADTLVSRGALWLCDGDSLLVNGRWIKDAGVYPEYLTSSSGCDSVHYWEVFTGMTTFTEETQVICPGDSAFIFDYWEQKPGSYTRTFNRQEGCDSVHVIHLQKVEPTPMQALRKVCPGGSLRIGNDTITDPGEYTHVYSSSAGCDSTVVTTVSLAELPDIRLNIQPPCFAGDLGEAAFVPEGWAHWRWSNGDSSLANVQLAPGAHKLAAQTSDGCVAFRDFEIPLPGFAALELATSNETCPGAGDGTASLLENPGNLQILLNNTDQGTQDEWRDLAPGDYHLVLRNNNGCEADLSFSIAAADPLSVRLPGDTSILLGDSLYLRAEIQGRGPMTYTWNDPETVDCINCPNTLAHPLVNTRYELVVTDENNCKASDDILVSINFEGKVYIPNAFSPNGDGQNDDFFFYTDTPVERVNRFQMFDRWGNLLYEALDFEPEDYNYAWDGQCAGRKMNPGIYVYYLELEFADGERESFKGDVVLIR